MRLQLLCCCSALVLAVSARGGIIYSATSGSIPDNNPTGWSATAKPDKELGLIADVSVHLQLSGGYNGDLYAYLSYTHGSQSVLVPLLNRVGMQTGTAFGYGDTGFNITLSSAVADDVHFYRSFSPSFDSETGQLLGTWQPDGRAIDPLSPPGSYFSPDANRVSFGSYNGMNPNGTWTLFFADLSAGETSQLVDWSLSITEVPEPVNVALAVFGGVVVIVSLVRSRWLRNLLRQAFDR